MPTQLLEKTLALIDARHHSITLRKLAQVAEVTEGTLQNIISGRTKNPGVNTIEKLYTFLNNNSKV